MAMAALASSQTPPAPHPEAISLSPTHSTTTATTTNSDFINPTHPHDKDGPNSINTQKVHLISISISPTPDPDPNPSPSLARANSRKPDLSPFVGPGMLAASFHLAGPLNATNSSTTTIEPRISKPEPEADSMTKLLQEIKHTLAPTMTKTNKGEARGGSGVLTLLLPCSERNTTQREGDRSLTPPISSTMEKLRTQLPHILTAQGGPLDVDTTVVQDIPSLLLTAKIAGAAAELGYEFAEVRRLVGLVGDNVGTVAGSIEKRVARADGTEVAKEMLSRLLHHPGDDDHNPSQSPKSKMRMRVNSNEPVLLLNLSMHDNGNREKEKETIKTLLPSLLTLLSTTPYNIRPVRVYIDTETYSPLSLNKTPSPPINSNSKASLPFDFSISILNVVNTELGGHSMVQLLDHPSASPGWAGKGLIGKEDWEALLQGGDGWSVEGVMGLVMKNYVGVVRGKEEEEDEKVGGAGQEQADEQAVPSDIPAQAHDGENHTTLSKGEMEAAAEAEAEKDQDQDEFMSTASLPESPSQKFETKAESDGGQKGDEAEQEVITHESGEAMDSGVGRAATGFDTARESGREPSAEDEEFEMVDREQTLIDMVLGRGRT